MYVLFTHATTTKPQHFPSRPLPYDNFYVQVEVIRNAYNRFVHIIHSKAHAHHRHKESKRERESIALRYAAQRIREKKASNAWRRCFRQSSSSVFLVLNRFGCKCVCRLCVCEWCGRRFRRSAGCFVKRPCAVV